MPKRPPEAIPFRDGDLGRVERNRNVVITEHDRERWHGMLIHIGQSRGYSPKWSGAQYKQKFGVWPPWGASPQPIPPVPEVLAWVRSRMIAYAKAQAKMRGAA